MVNGASNGGTAMRHWVHALSIASLGLAFLAGAARAEPVDLVLDDLDELVAGAYEPHWRPIDRGSFQRFTSITTSISMPIAQSLAICFMCSGDAAAIAISNAFGNAHANASSIASGLGQAFSRADAVGPRYFFVMPTFTKPDVP